MPCELDLLLKALARKQLIVEKATNVSWNWEDLFAAQGRGQLTQEDRLAVVNQPEAVTSPFPGCMQQSGASDDFAAFRLLGQTRHFLVFAPPA